MTKKLLIAGGILAVILVVAVKYLASNLDSIVKKAITTVGSEMTGVSVDVDDVAIALADGRGEIGGLVVGNPRGYKGPHAFKLGSILLAIDAAADTKDVVVIRELTVEAPDIVYDKGRTAATSRPSRTTSTSTPEPTRAEDRAKDPPTKDERVGQALHHRIASDPQRQDPAPRQGRGDRPAAAQHARYRQEPGRHDRQ